MIVTMNTLDLIKRYKRIEEKMDKEAKSFTQKEALEYLEEL